MYNSYVRLRFAITILTQTYNEPMIIPKKTLKVWADLKEYGDVAALAKAIGKSEPTVWKILKEGKAKAEYVEKINAFYKERQKKVSVPFDDNN